MSEELPVATSGGWLAEWAANGKIPGAVKAIARLVGASAEAGTAWIGIASVKGEQLQQAIKDETAAKTAMSKALTKAAATHAVNDAALVERAVEQWAGKRLRSQQNREAIAAIALEHLKEGDQFENNTDVPSDDWLNLFEQFAEQASSDKLRDTWARVLAGEIRKPGTFSHRTLQFLTVLDQNLATNLEKLLSRVSSEKYVFFNESIVEGQELEDLQTLQEVGLIRFGNLNCTMSSQPGNVIILSMRDIAIAAIFDSERQIAFETIILSPVAREIMQVVRPQNSEEQMNYIVEKLKVHQPKVIAIVPIDNGTTLQWDKMVPIFQLSP